MLFNSFDGGISPSILRATQGSFPDAVGVDIHSTPGLLKIAQAMAKESAAIVTALCKNVCVANDGNSYWFSSLDGKIWKRTAAAVWSLVHTNTGGACLGTRIYGGYIYYACAATLGRQSIALAASEASWSSENDAYQAFDNDDSEYHPMEEANNILYIGDGKDIASFDGTIFTAAALTSKLPDEYRASALFAYGIDLLIGTYVGTSQAVKVNFCKIFRWDTVSTQLNDADAVWEAGINAFIPMDNNVLVSAGMAGNIYYYDGSRLIPYMNIPGTYSPTAYNIVYNQAVGYFKGLSLFGVSNSPDTANSAGNPAYCGIYSIGRHNKNFPTVLSLPYPVNATLPLAGVEIGCIAVIGNDLFASWGKQGGTPAFGIDKLSNSAKYASAYLETPVITDEIGDKKVVEIKVGYKLKPTSTAVSIKHKKNYDTTAWASIAAMTQQVETNDKTISAKEGLIDCRAIQTRYDFTANANDAMELDLINIDFS